MASQPRAWSLLQSAAGIVLILGILICCLHLIVIVGGGVTERAALLYHVGVAAAALMVGVGLASLISGIQAMQNRKPQPPSEIVDALATIHGAIGQLSASIQRLQSAAQTPAAAGATPAAQRDTANDERFERMILLLEDIRELSMMSEAQRQSAYRQHVELQKQEALDGVSRFIQEQQWGQADAILQRLAEQFPNDPAVARSRQELETSRGAVEGDAFMQASQLAETHMANSSWDQAFYAARKFAEDFPHHVQGQELLQRVIKERELFRESAVGRMYHEIRTEIDNRNWRSALAAAQKLMDQYPEHPRTNLIRQQLGTIRENAEIEERQEQEVRIQALVRERKLQEAIDLAEQLIDKYPDSPQAESLERLIPQMREMLNEDDHNEALTTGKETAG